MRKLKFDSLKFEIRRNSPPEHFQQAVRAIVTNVRDGRPHFFARLLSEKLRKLLDHLMYNDEDAHFDLRRILVTRAQIDLADIVEVFNQPYYRRQFTGYHGLRNLLIMARGRSMNTFDAIQLDYYVELVDLVIRYWEPTFLHSRMQSGLGGGMHHAPPPNNFYGYK